MTSASSIDLGFDVLRNDDQFASVAAQWNRLADRSDRPGVFLRHEWFDAAWQWSRDSAEMCIVQVCREGMPIGIVPLMRRWVRARGLRIRQLEFLSVPDAEICDAIGDPADMPAVAESFVHFLQDGGCGWDRVSMTKLRSNSVFAINLCEALRQRRFRYRIERHGSIAGIDLRDDWHSFYARRTRRLKKGNNHVANKLRRAYSDIVVEWVRGNGASEQDFDRALREVERVSAASWKRASGHTVNQPGPAAFVRRLAEHARRESWMSIWLLHLDKRVAATEVQLIYNGQVSALRADFDPDFSELSPGTYLNWKILERLFDESLQNYTMGPGGNAYKMRWAEEHDPQVRLDIYAPNWRGIYLAVAELGVRPVVRRLRDNRS